MGIYNSPNETDKLVGDEDEQKVGFIEHEHVFDLDIPDRELQEMLWQDIQKSRNFWNNFLSWKSDRMHSTFVRANNVRELGELVYQGVHHDYDEFYDYNERYTDNRTFVNIDTLLPLITDNVPMPVVTPANEKKESARSAQVMQSVLTDGFVRWGVQRAFKTSLLHLLIAKRIGILKGRFDPDKGKNGELEWTSVRPESVVIDKNALPGENPRFVAQFLDETVDELMHRFPDKKSEIFKEAGIIRGTRKQLTKRVGYVEVWFTYRDEDIDELREGVVWFMNKVVLGKMKDPNWIEDTGESEEKIEEEFEGAEERTNWLNSPQKPFVFINFDDLNMGEHFLDDTSLLEQALSPQFTLNKRGRQIGENADQASSGLVYDKTKLPPEAAQELTGDPNERIGVDGDVRSAIARYQPLQLPQYVINEKQDARDVIDTIFSIQQPVQGKRSRNRTLGQDILQTQESIGRNEGNIASAMERAADTTYKFSMQLMKVHYTEDHFAQIAGDEGHVEFIKFNADAIEDGQDVKVEPGSLLPTDKFSKRAEAIQLFQIGALDLLTLYEELGIPNPEKTYERWIQFKTDPTRVDPDGSDEEITEGIAKILKGEEPQIPVEVNEKQITQLNDVIQKRSKEFTPEQQESLKSYAQNLIEKAQGGQQGGAQ